jgi:hypothetical protein
MNGTRKKPFSVTPQAKKDFLTAPPTAQQIEFWFEEWKNQRQSKTGAPALRKTRAMPSETQCAKIAEKCASIAARHDPPDPIWAVGKLISPVSMMPVCELIARDPLSIGFDEKMGKVILAANAMETAILNFRSWKDNFPGLEEAEMLPEITAMENSLTVFLSKWRRGGKPGPGRPQNASNLFNDFYAKWIAEWCKEALEEAGWRENASAKSEQGPAVYVTAKILSALEKKDFSPEWVAKAIKSTES